MSSQAHTRGHLRHVSSFTRASLCNNPNILKRTVHTKHYSILPAAFRALVPEHLNGGGGHPCEGRCDPTGFGCQALPRRK